MSIRRPVGSRAFRLIVLLLSLVGMWHEKEARDTWGQLVLRQQIQDLRQKLEETHVK